MPDTKEKFDTLSFIMKWESEDMDSDELVEGFQHLIDSGIVWSLPGCYGSMAKELIETGLCYAG